MLNGHLPPAPSRRLQGSFRSFVEEPLWHEEVLAVEQEYSEAPSTVRFYVKLAAYYENATSVTESNVYGTKRQTPSVATRKCLETEREKNLWGWVLR